MSSLALWSVINIVALIAGLAIYLFIVSSQLKKVATNLEDSADLVWDIKKDAEAIALPLDVHQFDGTCRRRSPSAPVWHG